MKERRIFRISAIFFASLLILNFGLVNYFNYQVISWRYQDRIADDIIDNVSALSFILNEYSFNSSTQEWALFVASIEGNTSLLIVYTSSEQKLITRFNDSFNQLRPLLNSTVPSSNETKVNQWSTIFTLISSIVSSLSELSIYVDSNTNTALQYLVFLMVSFVLIMVAFLVFIYFQIYGRTLRTSESLQHKGESLQKTNTQLESLIAQQTKELRDSERLAAIGQTAGMVGHDIRNPLQAIMSDMYLLKDYVESIPDQKNKEEAEEILREVEDNIAYINKIVADLQDYSRTLKPEYTKVALSNILTLVLQTMAVPNNIKLFVEVKGSPELRTDETFVRRALTNLINNGIQAMPSGGTLEVIGYQNESNVIITVSDTGVGIPDDVKPKLFTPMMTTKSKGQGLGLAVVKRLVEVLGGTVGFESEAGKGTKFTISLPVNENKKL